MKQSVNSPSEGPGFGCAVPCSVSGTAYPQPAPVQPCTARWLRLNFDGAAVKCLWKPILALGLKLPVAICLFNK